MKVLFVAYGGGHVNMIVPVVRSLLQKGFLQVEVLGMTTARSVLEKNSIQCSSFSDLPIDEAALAYGKSLVGKQVGHPLVSAKESIAYMGLSYKCLVDELGKEAAAERYLKKGRQAFLPVALMEEVIRNGGYDLVVATNSPRAERAAIIAAGNLSVPSLCIVDLFATQGVKWLGKRGYASRVCVLSNEVKERLCSAGRQNSEVVVTGNPAFDYLADPSIKESGDALRLKKGWDKKKVVLWCSQLEPLTHPFTGEKGEPELPRKVELALQQACDAHSLDDWHLFVRPHPSENLETRKYVPGVEYGRDDELASLLKAVDVVVVTSSTVGLEAILLGVPVVALSISIFSADMPFAEMGMADGVDQLEQLEPMIEKVLLGRKKDVKGLPEVGRATKNVTNEIFDLLSKKGDRDV